MTETYYNWGTPKPEELRKLGFEYCDRRMKVSMVYSLNAMMTPMTIKTSWGEILVAEDPSYVIVLLPVEPDESRPMHQLDRHPIRWDVFAKSYKMLDIETDHLTQAEQSLVKQGARPYYKFLGVWAKEVSEETFIRGMEHKEPVEVPIGNVLCLGVDGEPYSMTMPKFQELYVSEHLR